ncbi:Ribonuclease H1, partial [Marasmius crinis-equi]
MVMEIGDIFFISAYLPPENMEWMDNVPTHPCDHFEDVLTRCSTCLGMSLVIMLDSNGRMASLSPNRSFPRLSRDRKSNARGKWLLFLCSKFGLCVVNGSSLDSDPVAEFSSFHMGSALVDYVIISESLSDRVVSPLHVDDQFPHESDHATLQIGLAIAKAGQPAAEALQSSRKQRKFDFGSTSSPLDRQLENTIASATDPRSLAMRLYGSASVNGTPRQVFIASVHAKSFNGQQQMGVGILWGYNSAAKGAFRISGHQTSLRADLCAIAAALQMAKTYDRMVIYTKSEAVVRNVAFDVGIFAESNWTCSNADILRLIVAEIQRRESPVELRVLKQNQATSEFEGARELAVRALRDRLAVWVPRPTLPPTVSGSMDGQLGCRVQTALKPLQGPSPAASGRSDYPIPLHRRLPPKPAPERFNPPSHRTRFAERERQWHNLSQLLNARSSAQFWKVI